LVLEELGWESVEWIALDQDGNRWQAFVNVAKTPAGFIQHGDFID
jgi:hypothetical protein